MPDIVKIKIKKEDIISAVRGMNKREREAFVEDLLAITSPEYLSSIKAARAEYRAGKVKGHKEVFGS